MRSVRSVHQILSPLHSNLFQIWRTVMGLFPGGRISAFGPDSTKISKVLVINLDRQPRRFQQTMSELGRFRTFNNHPLSSISHRLAAVDARDGREVASTVDVDPAYRIGDQLYVQPDARLQESFHVDEQVRMTRQEIAVARSHVEAWKAVVAGEDEHVLILEDDIWFTRGATKAIDRGWIAAWERFKSGKGPPLLYLSYEDAGGTAARTDVCENLFRPIRGLWWLSGYVLSRTGAETLLRSMPVVGPVDMWINRQFEKLHALALASPVVLQRPDTGSDNKHSIVPFLARAGIVDASAPSVPGRSSVGPVIGWSARAERDSLAMALSMLGLRVRVFDGDEADIGGAEFQELLRTFDALIDPPLSHQAIITAVAHSGTRFVIEGNASNGCFPSERHALPASRTYISPGQQASWRGLCDLLALEVPPHAYPLGPSRSMRMFRDDRPILTEDRRSNRTSKFGTDDSAWALIPNANWPRQPEANLGFEIKGCLFHESLTAPSSELVSISETFPGNMALFNHEGLSYSAKGATLTVDNVTVGSRSLRSGALASVSYFQHGRYEAEIMAAGGAGLITGLFLHRSDPRQEIDIELVGADPRQMLVNVYFNPGDEGAAIGFGYRGSPCKIDLGFDSTVDFHHYAIEWHPSHISWWVDGKIVHQRASWDPTPIPHLPMRLHANLWAPRSEELAGRLDPETLPARSFIRNVKFFG